VDSIRIALVSDDRLFCDGITGILISGTGFEVSTYDAHQVPSIADVDIVLIDSRLADACSLCAAVLPASSLMIATPGDEDWCREALCAGASGVLPKTARANELLQAVRVVHEGSIWAPRRVMASCIRQLAAASLTRRDGVTQREQQLSHREREIFLQAATGLANKELASRFAIGEATVKAHMTRIFQKLGVRGRAELAALYHGVGPMRQPRPAPPLLSIAAPTVVRRKSNLATAGRPKK